MREPLKELDKSIRRKRDMHAKVIVYEMGLIKRVTSLLEENYQISRYKKNYTIQNPNFIKPSFNPCLGVIKLVKFSIRFPVDFHKVLH